MRQKYMLIHDADKKNLKIREYAIIAKNLEKKKTSMLRDEDYCLVYEENYDSAIIINSISNGTMDLITTLRTPRLFPAAPNAAKIAQSVISLYASAKNGSVDLFFNDTESNTNV